MTTRHDQLRERREKIAADVRDNPKRTYQVIGDDHGISRERVRQIAKRYGVNRRAVEPRICKACFMCFNPALSACPTCGTEIAGSPTSPA